MATILVLAGLVGPVQAVRASNRGVVDEGQFFSAKAADAANEKIHEIARKYNKDVLIDTVPGVPAEQESKYKEQGKQAFFGDWAEQRASRAGVKGIYILLAKQPGHLQVEVDKATRQRAFTAADRNQLVQKMLPLLKEKKNDEALRLAVDTVASTIERNGGRKAAAGQGAASSHEQERSHSSSGLLPGHSGVSSRSLVRWLLIGGGVLLAIWILSALFRAMRGGAMGSGDAGGAAGPGGAMGPGAPGGAGGGGFLTSLVGGVFGAAAGNWLYDSFFRHGNWGGSQAYGAEQHGENTDQGNYSQEAGAGDFSGDAGGGGDFGDGSGAGLDGGDFGGGDFGGGDFGGD